MSIPSLRRLFYFGLLFLVTALPASTVTAAQERSEDRSERYKQAAKGCANGNDNNCHTALSLYARDISNDDIGPVIAMLQENCTDEKVTACEALASAYGSFKNSSSEGTIRIGIDSPKLRDAILRKGCAKVLARGNTCSQLGSKLASAGDIDGASVVYNRVCGYVRNLPKAERFYIEDWDCYSAAKHALLQARDYAGAQRDFQLVCAGNTAGLAPYGCKYLGQIYEGGLGVAIDQDMARDYYARSCFHRNVDDSDGEGCLLYGQRMIADRNRVWIRESDVGEGDTMPSDPHAVMAHFALEEASRAFQRGCATAIPLACEANETLALRLLDGEFGFPNAQCFVRDQGEPAPTARTCRTVTRYPNYQGRVDRPSSLTETIYIWPDGERTVLRHADGSWQMNGKIIASPTLYDEYRCSANTETGREFCVLPQVY